MAKIAILGFGTVGSGVYEVLCHNAASVSRRAGEPVEVKYILDPKDFTGNPVEPLVVKNIDVILQDPEIRVVVETIGGVEAAYEYTKRALNAGKHVVTANKQLVAEKGAELLALAKKRGLIVLTDSDGAGFLIRGKLSSSIPPEQIKHAYIPDILGKERRKAAPSKEGKLGVEGMELSVLRQALERAGATVEDGPAPQKETAPPLTKADLFQLGLTGGEDSAARRQALQKRLGLPERLSANGLLQALNALYSRDELRAALEKEE